MGETALIIRIGAGPDRNGPIEIRKSFREVAARAPQHPALRIRLFQSWIDGHRLAEVCDGNLGLSQYNLGFASSNVGICISRRDFEGVRELSSRALEITYAKRAGSFVIVSQRTIGRGCDPRVNAPSTGAECDDDPGDAQQAALAAIEAPARRQGRRRLDGIPHPHKKRSGHSRKDYSNAEAGHCARR
jgi:hypothetical protein